MTIEESNLEAAASSDQREILLSTLRRKSRKFPADRLADARQLAADQEQWWRQILSAIESGMPARSSDREMVRRVTAALNVIIQKGISGLATSEVPDGGWLVEGRLPLLVPEGMETAKSIAKEDPWFVIAALLLAFAPLHQSADNNNSRGTFGDPGVSNSLTDPRMTRALLQVGAIENGNSDKVAKQLENLRTINRRALANLSKIEERARDSQRQLDDVQANWFKLESSANIQLEAWKEQVADAIKLETNRNLWAARTTRHHYWMIGSFFAMVVGVAIAIVGLFEFALPALNPTLFEVITKSSYVSHKLAIVTVCVIGFAWVLRFVARAIVENMTLKSDAQHRKTMLDTYLILRGENAMSDTERHLILAALFRPLPGHSPEELPPTPAVEALRRVTNN